VVFTHGAFMQFASVSDRDVEDRTFSRLVESFRPPQPS
jgi:hypothetical protein